MNTGGKTAGKRTKKTTIIVAVAMVLAVIVAAGVGLLVRQRHTAARLADAKAACAQASDAARVAQNEYNTLHDGPAAEAAAITGKQVEDAATVTTLAAAYKQEAPAAAACNVDGVDALGQATARIDTNTAWYETHTADLEKAVDAVNESYGAKTLKDAKEALGKQLKAAQAKVKATDGKVKDGQTRQALKDLIDKATKTRDGKDTKAMGEQAKRLKDLMGKVDASVKAKQDEDKRQAEQQARREAEAQAAAAAQAQATAPQQSYTTPQQTYTTPQQSATPQYTAPAAPQPAAPSTPNTGSGGGIIFNHSGAGQGGCGPDFCGGTYDGFNHNGF